MLSPLQPPSSPSPQMWYHSVHVQRTNIHTESIHRCLPWIMSQNFSHGGYGIRNSNYENTMNTAHKICVPLCHANNGGWQWRRWEKVDNANSHQSRRRRRMAQSFPPSHRIHFDVSLSHQLTLNKQHSHKYHIINLFSNWIYVCQRLSSFGKGKGESRKSHIIYFPGWSSVRARECYTLYSISMIACTLFSGLLS